MKNPTGCFECGFAHWIDADFTGCDIIPVKIMPLCLKKKMLRFIKRNQLGVRCLMKERRMSKALAECRYKEIESLVQTADGRYFSVKSRYRQFAVGTSNYGVTYALKSDKHWKRGDTVVAPIRSWTEEAMVETHRAVCENLEVFLDEQKGK